MKKKQSGSSAKILKFNHPLSARLLDEVVAVLRKGGLIAYPTDTFYALGGDPFNEKAVRSIFEVKKRDPSKPVPVVVSDVGKATAISLNPSPIALRLMERFWPGPLTLLLSARPTFSSLLLGGTGKIAVRVPDHSSARSLLEAWGGPITSTSANPSGSAPFQTAGEVAFRMDRMVDLILDGGSTPGGLPSTIVDATFSPPRLVRAGAVLFGDIVEAAGFSLTDDHDW